MSHIPINADTARSLIRDQIAFTRGMPSSAYVEEILTRLVQAARRTDSIGSVYWLSDTSRVMPTWSTLPDGHILVEWKLVTAD